MGIRPSYHPLDGQEVKAAILKRVEAGMGQAIDTRAFRSYPLVKWRITIEVTPCEHAGADLVHGELVAREPVEMPTDTFQLAGYDFVEVHDEAVQLSESSPVVGLDKDPQEVREQAGLGKLVTKAEEGQHVDTYAPLKPAAPKETPVPVVVGPGGVSPEVAEKIAREEERDWSDPKADTDFQEAISSGEPVKGRVTVRGSGVERKPRRG